MKILCIFFLHECSNSEVVYYCNTKKVGMKEIMLLFVNFCMYVFIIRHSDDTVESLRVVARSWFFGFNAVANK